jgi:hypothetical protein
MANLPVIKEINIKTTKRHKTDKPLLKSLTILVSGRTGRAPQKALWQHLLKETHL